MPKTVDQKTVAWIEANGYMAGKVECRNRHISRDLWGFIDFVGVRLGKTIAVQATDHTNFSKRLKKALANESLPRVLDAWEFWVIGFKPNDDAMPYRLRRVTHDDIREP